MGYVAVKGGQEAIDNAGRLYAKWRHLGASPPLTVAQIAEQMRFAVDRVMSEGSLYAPALAALALKQSCGDTLEASFLLRAYRTTRPRIGYSLPQSTFGMRILRRISAAFKDIPGGQILGPTPDYTLRLLDFRLFNENAGEIRAQTEAMLGKAAVGRDLPGTFPKVVEMLRRENLLELPDHSGEAIVDVTRESLTFPAPRSAALQTMARGETGGLLALAYSNMRGYGMVHPTIAELRVGWLPVHAKHPITGEAEFIGEVLVTEAEVLSEKISSCSKGGGVPKFTLGYGLCFGHNETKAIAMAVLDRAMQTENPRTPSEDAEFVLTHVDGIEAMGFCNHYKLPHYVTFQSALDRLRKAQSLATTSDVMANDVNADASEDFAKNVTGPREEGQGGFHA